MQTRNPLLDELSKLTTGAMGLAQTAGEEAKAAMRAQADRWVADMDLVRRDEYDALRAEVAALRVEIAALRTPSAAAAAEAPAPTAAPKTGTRRRTARPTDDLG
ncbi:MAG TPA: accessory factor UbiK family protein [Caulobacteraceae bacterium]|jgi:BMFP domain-containing protein YqiC